MYGAVAIAATGLQKQQQRMDSIAHNVSNVNTAGFKKNRLDFKDAMYTAGIYPARPRYADGNLQKGNGVQTAGTAKTFSQGIMQDTGRTLDAAIEGEGFFSLQNANGETVYTRVGNFDIAVDQDGPDRWLVDGNGYWVLDENGERIQIPEDTTSIEIDEEGVIAFTVGDEKILTTLGIFTFRNVMGLESVGDSVYAVTEASGERLPADNMKVRQGAIEGSNVNLAEEMTRLIRTQRAFSLASRALTTADEMERIANDMRR